MRFRQPSTTRSSWYVHVSTSSALFSLTSRSSKASRDVSWLKCRVSTSRSAFVSFSRVAQTLSSGRHTTLRKSFLISSSSTSARLQPSRAKKKWLTQQLPILLQPLRLLLRQRQVPSSSSRRALTRLLMLRKLLHSLHRQRRITRSSLYSSPLVAVH